MESSLNKHIAKKHPDESSKENLRESRISCPNCSEKFITLTSLIHHLEKSHNEKVPINKLSFESMKEFYLWKKQEEQSSDSLYVQDSGCRLQGLNCKRYYYCHRSGVFKAKGKGLRVLKIQGSCKINQFCTANMQVSEDTVTGKVTVTHCSQHIGHTLDMSS
ncbi:PREDICTED: uncharacterized protein LOC100635716 [Amphimedon queenslandica]|uniref:C2H2-type domain-containing protein n=1 Tax=Amphimedon queenslandica TaxID=400682 RepID=A0AAN0ISR9_AMPQE|nr:PREDICTED: uncharacterized protein LOC100635716 [Amphimedon queenslandica]|eukprot:XP_011408624.2 PREDICTED: uncharacterized protein LOC100635716 [Amphimedon queenslandica]